MSRAAENVGAQVDADLEEALKLSIETAKEEEHRRKVNSDAAVQNVQGAQISANNGTVSNAPAA